VGDQIVPNALDVTPPTKPAVEIAKVRLGRDSGCAGGGDCRDLTYVDFAVSSHDDVSQEAELGYLFEDNLAFGLGDVPLVADASGQIRIYLNGTLQAEGPDFDVRVFAVDEAGNVSTDATVVTVDRSDDGGCSVAPKFSDAALWVSAALALLARSRRQRASSPR
jgi:hypothetical protein